MNRIDERFAQLRAAKPKGLIVYIGAGDPDLEATRRLALAFEPDPHQALGLDGGVRRGPVRGRRHEVRQRRHCLQRPPASKRQPW